MEERSRRNGSPRWRRLAVGLVGVAVAAVVVMVVAEPFAKNSSSAATVIDLTPQGCVKDLASSVNCAQSTGGLEGAKSVAVSPDGKSVYAAAAWAPALVRFDRDPATGALTPAGCVTDTILEDSSCSQQTYGLAGAESVVVSPDGLSVYVAARVENTVVRFDRDPATGALTPAGCIQDDNEFLIQCGQMAPALSQVASVAVSPDGKSVYAASNEDDAVVEFERNTSGNVGALAPVGCIDDEPTGGKTQCDRHGPGLNGAAGVTVSPDGNSVYVASEFDNALVRFDRSGSTGALTYGGCIDDNSDGPDSCGESIPGLRGVRSVAVSPDGKSAYAASYYSDEIVRFGRNASSGVLTPQGCLGAPGGDCAETAPGLYGPEAVSVSPSGDSVYAVALVGSLVGFDRDESSGALAFAGCVTDPGYLVTDCETTADGLDGPYGVAVSPDGKSVYTAAELGDSVAHFSRVVAGRLSGRVKDADGNTVAGAPVEICPSGGICLVRVTDSGGEYRATGLPDGIYQLRANPPAGLEALPGTAGPVTISGAAVVQDITLGETLKPLPPDASITNREINPEGIPTVHWMEDLHLTANGCPGATHATYGVRLEGATVRSGAMVEQSSGFYTAWVPQLYPAHGAAVVKIEITCPSGPPTEISFGIYIDPSGVVSDATTGDPIGGATVTLLRSDVPGGPFTQVPEGSAIMSAGNRANPDTTASDGSFGWDVIAGYYEVHAAANGCNPAQTGVLTIPPPVTDLELKLSCPSEEEEKPSPPVTTPTTPAPPPPAPPSSSFGFGRVTLNKATGRATLEVRVPGPGALVLSGRQVKKAAKTTKSPGSVKLAVVPVGGAKTSLAKTGKATVKVSVKYTPAGGEAAIRTKKIKLEKR